jgi:hypothetical protein
MAVIQLQLLQFLLEVGRALHEIQVILRFAQLLSRVLLELLLLPQAVQLVDLVVLGQGPLLLGLHLIAVFLVLFADMRRINKGELVLSFILYLQHQVYVLPSPLVYGRNRVYLRVR